MLLLETFCTNQMKRFGRMGAFLRGISINGSAIRAGNIYKLICISISIPCFKLADLFFQIAYLLQQRRLILATRNRALLCGQDPVIPSP